MGFHPGILSKSYRKLLLIFLGSLVLTGQAIFARTANGQDSGFSIGFPAIGRGVNILKSTHPAAFVLRAALTRGLTARTDRGNPFSYRLDLSDNMSVSADYLRWSFRLKSDLRFSNGKALSAEDVRFSLLRCGEEKVFPFELRSVSLRQVGADSDGSRDWVDLEVAPGALTFEGLGKVAALLAQCPILERESSTLFGADLGLGSNLIAAGDYAVSGFKANGEYELVRFSSRMLVGNTGAGFILRPFDEVTRAVSALRGGTIDALFLSGDEGLSAAAGDATLVASECMGFKVLKRRGLEMPCEGALNLSDMRYKS